jgi:3-hydroxybutyryl-CoA dehydratase
LIRVGDSASRSKTITDDDVRGFARILGDANPIHLDDAYAAGTRFGRRLVHGPLVAAMIPLVIANDFPGVEIVYLGESLRFTGPVFPGDTITARVTATKVREDKPIVTFAAVCTNQDGATVLEGEAVVRVSAA